MATIRNRHSETVDRALNRHSETVDMALVLWNSVPGPKFHRGACVLVHRLSYPLGRTWIFVRPAIGTAREAPIRNRHLDPVGTSSGSLDYANRWRGQHTESVYHNDRKSCSTRLEISTTAKELSITFRPGIGIAYVTTIRNWHSETVDRVLVSWNSISGPKFHHGACVLVHRLLYLGRGYLFARRSERPARPQFGIGTSTRSAQGRIRRFLRFPVRLPNSSLGAWSRAADAIAYEHPFAQTGITFRSIIKIAYKTPIKNRHSKAPVAPLSPQAKRHRFGVEKPSFRTPKLRFQPTISPILRFSGSSAFLDYANRWRGQHTESVYHDDQKSCSTQLEISTTSRRYGCVNIKI
ncbi:hypothetical protein Taro_014916 [Colocasia esculenta]|uniref:Uncharacterized protein n=1 Tax=Colocasia esculenta TaxID=4460 RepID=A0A843UG74_COLES|nr:hypothetical protein [Colocasia esculenta]